MQLIAGSAIVWTHPMQEPLNSYTFVFQINYSLASNPGMHISSVKFREGGPVFFFFFFFTSVGAVDPTAVIVSPCQSLTYWRSTAAQARDTYWLKGQPYSLLEMLDYDTLAPRFL